MSLAKSLFKAAQAHERKKLLAQSVPEAQIVQTKWSAIGEESQAYWKAVAKAAKDYFGKGTAEPEPHPHQKRETFTIPEGWEAERGEDGRATGKLIPAKD